MRLFGALYLLALLISPTILLPGVAAGQECVTGNITAEISSDPGFDNLYKYTVEVNWNLSAKDLGHPSIFLALENCECICNPRFMQFAPIAGQTTGSNDEGFCSNDYGGEYACLGDPSIPDEFLAPAVKFEPDESTCDPGTSGQGVFSFYSPMPPAPATVVLDALAIKHGQNVCVGPISGTGPSCNCFLQVERGSWGSVKAIYR